MLIHTRFKNYKAAAAAEVQRLRQEVTNLQQQLAAAVPRADVGQ
jgi:hypothetical protein